MDRALKTVGPYRLLGELGRGGQGRVYLAEDPQLGRRVSIKMLGRLGSLSAEARDRMRRESALAARLDHQGLCSVYEAGEHGGVPYLVMQHVPGPTLADRIVAGEGTDGGVDEVLLLGERIARALHAAHEGGVVHGDVKPQNVIVSRDGRPVLIDFGLAREEAARGGSPAGGTLDYLAPEQLEGNAVDRRADVYGLGVTLYECFTGERPFGGGGQKNGALGDIVARRDFDARGRGLPRDLQAVLGTATAFDPDRRYRSAELLAEDLRRLRSGDPVGARPESLFTRVRRWVRRNPGAAWLAAVLSVAFVATLVLLLALQKASRGAEQALGDFDAVVAAVQLDDLREQESGLVPPWPDQVGPLQDWFDRASTLTQGLPHLRAKLVGLEQPVAVERLGARRVEFLRGALADFVSGLALVETVTLPDVRDRLTWARTVVQRTVRDQRVAWDRAIYAIRNDPVYEGLELGPQIGLVPLEPDPESGLWEFWHSRSGTRPVRDGETGRWSIDGDTGMVFVLLPPGTVRLHCGQGNLMSVRLASCLLSKYEVTQGQWKRLTGEQPSRYQPNGVPGVSITLAHPVENIDWLEASRFVRALGLCLPTGAQLHHAARLDDGDRWWDRLSVRERAEYGNLFDASRARWLVANGDTLDLVPFDADDGFPLHAPVDAFRPSVFGVHGLVGNVKEAAVDDVKIVDTTGLRAGDGRRLGVSSNAGTAYGASFWGKGLGGMVGKFGVGGRYSSTGVRPARAILAWREP